MPEGFYNTQNYNFAVLFSGILGLIIGITVLLIAVLNMINQFRKNILIKNRLKPENVQDLRQKFYSTIDNIEQLFVDGEMTEDGVYYEVSRALRNYATGKTGQDVRYSSRRDLQDIQGLGVLHETIDLLYKPEFYNREYDPNPMTPQEVLEHARAMVRRW